MTTPAPCGGGGKGTGAAETHMWISAPPAELVIVALMDAASAAFNASSAAMAAGAPGVPIAAVRVASEAVTRTSDAVFAAIRPATAAAPMPRATRAFRR